jgi:DNA-directed RNA polymerase specialized sigma54-like protein
MRMEVHLQQRLEQRMHLSQQMLQNLELLQLPAMDLRELILQELQENPALEEKPDVEEPEAGDEAESEADAARREALESVEEQWIESERRTRRGDSSEEAERRIEMLNNVCKEGVSLREHLADQLALMELEEGIRPFCAHVIENIDENGFLPAALEDMVSSLPEDLRKEPPEILVRKVERAISILQTLEPRGVAARSIKECLLLQLDEGDPRYPLLRRIVEDHLEDVAANRLPRIVKAFGADPAVMKDLGYTGEPDPNAIMEDVKQLLAEVAKLKSRPGAGFSSDRVPRVFPEVTIKKVDGEYEIVLEDGWLPPIAVSRNYDDLLRERKLNQGEKERAARLSQDPLLQADERRILADLGRGKRLLPADRAKIAEIARREGLGEEDRRFVSELTKDPAVSKDERDYIKQKMEAGRKLISAIEQRRGTIYRITEQILKRQMDFFESGVEHLKPLKMQEVADAVGIHLSTVSRAISEKWVETPRGIFPLKFFFASAAPRAEPAPGALYGGGALPSASSPSDAPDDQTRLALMEKIREILDGEDPKNPMSDLEVVQLLKDRHRITAARRTIAKYREEMGIPSSRLRRKY